MPLPRSARSSLTSLRRGVLALFVGGCCQAEENWPLVVPADRAAECAGALSRGRERSGGAALASPFTVFNWNVQKAGHTDLVREFAAFANKADLIFLQEAVPLRKAQVAIEQSFADAFVRGYVQNEIETGVLTLARVPHTVHCHLTALEPWLRTPKATSITLYPLEDTGETLLTVNLHAINFSLGVEAYRAQLTQAGDLIAAHPGPVIFAGDLNSWSGARQEILDLMTSQLQLKAIPFAPDHRTTSFGRPLDHIYVRGLAWQFTQSIPVTTSDHNPLFATLRRSIR